MNKLVVCSFEDALIDEEDAIEYKTMLEIDRVRKKGNYFCVVSSNTLDFILEYNRDFLFLDYIISSDGACIFDVKSNEYLLKKCIAKLKVKKITKLFKDFDITIYTYEEVYNNNNIDVANVFRIDICYDNMDKIADKLSELDHDLGLNVDIDESIIKITSKNINREKSMNFLSKKLNIKQSNIFIIGCSGADKRNIEKYGGVVVRNAPFDVKEAARYVSDNERSKGVYELLQKFLK